MINFLLLLYLPLAWFLARALRHPRDAALWMLVVCLVMRTVDGPWVMPAVRGLVGPSAARWFFDAALTGSWAALLLFFVLSAGGSAVRARREVGTWAVLCAVLGACVALAPGWWQAQNLLAQPGHPAAVTAFEALVDLYYVYATGSCAVWAWRYASESPKRLRPGLWLAAAGLGVFALASAASLAIVLGLLPPSFYSAVLVEVMGLAIVAFAIGVVTVGLVGRAVALRVWWRHRQRARALRPLWSLLCTVYPSDALDRASGGWWFDRILPHQVHRRYWRRWMEVRDGLVQLSPHLVETGYDPARPAHEQTGAFRAALRRAAAGQQPGRAHARPVAVPTSDSSEQADVQELIRLSTALRETAVVETAS